MIFFQEKDKAFKENFVLKTLTVFCIFIYIYMDNGGRHGH